MTEIKEKQVKAPAGTGKTLAGTEAKTFWENISDSIAGDNKLMAGALKMIINPVAPVVGGYFLLQWYNSIKEEREAHENLKKEHEALKKEYEELEEEYRRLKKKHKKLKASAQENDSLKGLGFIPQASLSTTIGKTYNTLYLD